MKKNVQLALFLLFAICLLTPGMARAADATNGKAIYNGSAGCKTCHKTTTDNMVGPGLAGTAQRHTDSWLVKWLTNPKKTWQENDEETLAMKRRLGKMNDERPGMRMRKNMTPEEAADLIAYLKTL